MVLNFLHGSVSMSNVKTIWDLSKGIKLGDIPTDKYSFAKQNSQEEKSSNKSSELDEAINYGLLLANQCDKQCLKFKFFFG